MPLTLSRVSPDAAALTENPARALVAVLEVLKLTLEVSFAEATVDVKENIFVFAVCLSMCFVRKVGKENGRWNKTGEKKNLKRRGFRV